MGGIESRPVYPTQIQWEEYKKTKLDKVDEEIREMKQRRDQIAKQQECSSTCYVNAMIDYMRECQDKSLLKRTFSNNESCTMAKEKLLKMCVKSINDISVSNGLVSEISKLEKLL